MAGEPLSLRLASDEQRVQMMVDSLEDYAIYMLDCVGNVVNWSQGAEQIFGYSSQEICGRNFRVFFDPEDDAAGQAGQELQNALDDGKTSGEGWQFRKNGERFWSSFAVSVMRNPDGKLIGYAKVAQDISKRKQQTDALLAVEQAVREERDTLRAAVESSMDALYICEAVRDNSGEIEDFVFTFLNANVAAMTSIPAGEILGGRLCALFPVIRSEGIFEMYKEVVRTGQSMVYEFPVQAAVVKSSWIRVQAVKLRDGIAITASDITSRKRDEERILHLAHHDPLTGLPNRSLLADRITLAMERGKRYSGKVAVFLIDIDCFKQINDTLGHEAGDSVLVTTAVRLKAAVRAVDSVIRIGGDEFVVVLSDIGEEHHILRCANKILNSLQELTDIGERQTQTTCSIGIAIYPGSGDTVEELLRHADAAMYLAKKQGKNRVGIFNATGINADRKAAHPAS